MDIVLRSIAVYVFLLLIFRIAGKRSLAQMSAFDFILLLIISEAIQQALIGTDNSMTRSALVVITLIMTEIGFTLMKLKLPLLEKWLDGAPIIIVKNGKPLQDRMHWTRVEEDDILSVARKTQGLERMDQIKYAVLEIGGGISIIPAPDAEKSN